MLKSMQQYLQDRWPDAYIKKMPIDCDFSQTAVDTVVSDWYSRYPYQSIGYCSYNLSIESGICSLSCLPLEQWSHVSMDRELPPNAWYIGIYDNNFENLIVTYAEGA